MSEARDEILNHVAGLDCRRRFVGFCYTDGDRAGRAAALTAAGTFAARLKQDAGRRFISAAPDESADESGIHPDDLWRRMLDMSFMDAVVVLDGLPDVAQLVHLSGGTPLAVSNAVCLLRKRRTDIYAVVDWAHLSKATRRQFDFVVSAGLVENDEGGLSLLTAWWNWVWRHPDEYDDPARMVWESADLRMYQRQGEKRSVAFQ